MNDKKEQNGTELPGNQSGAPDMQQDFEPAVRAPHGSSTEKKHFNRDRHHGRGRPDRRGSYGRRPGKHRFSGRRHSQRDENDPHIREIIHEAEQKLAESAQPVQLTNLNAFERKQVHRYFERRKPAIETKTYHGDDDLPVLWIFPVANLKKFAEEKAQEALDTGNEIALSPMSKYERFIVHNFFKEMENIEAVSVGEGAERHIEIHPKKFGRGLKKIMKKIKLL
jgi:hypothetical protein